MRSSQQGMPKQVKWRGESQNRDTFCMTSSTKEEGGVVVDLYCSQGLICTQW